MKYKIKEKYDNICKVVNQLEGIIAKTIEHNGDFFISFEDEKGRSSYSRRIAVKNKGVK